MYVDGIKTILADIKSVQLSLLQKGIEKKDNKAEYFKKKTAKFVLPTSFPRTDEYFEALLNDMFKELMLFAPLDADSLGLWIEYDTITFDNAISLQSLKDIEEYSKTEITPAYEFFKMTLPKESPNGFNGSYN
jgi:sporulation-control protein spo0M